MQSPNLMVLVDAVVGLAIIAAGVTLLCLGKIDGQTGIALIGAGAALASGSSKAAIALRVPASDQLEQAPARSSSAAEPAHVEPAAPVQSSVAVVPSPPVAQA